MTNERLFHSPALPIIPLRRGNPKMLVTVTVSDAIVREAGAHGMSVLDYVESLITKGRQAASARPDLSDAIERIRALRSPTIEAKR